MSEPQNERNNHRPGVMFEIIVQQAMKAFFDEVFDWHYQSGSDGFAHVDFGKRTLPLLGGIGQARPKVAGFEPGHNFYLLVDSLEPTIERAVATGVERFVPPTGVDGYRFAMIRYPEHNPIGRIAPFHR